jgi:catechol 2,3-dioxygenase-like lactoylglutathione lyase family enzyme
MPLASGCQHIALVTANLDRFIEFYTRIFDARTVFDMTEGPMRHAMVDLGGGLWLHPFQFPGEHPDAAGRPKVFTRGHLDHIAIEVPDRATLDLIRDRLVEAGASDGTLTDVGMLDLVTFHDPDGMEAEVALRKPGAPKRFEDRKHHPPPV